MRDRHTLLRAGTALRHVLLIVEGWAARVTVSSNDNRDISAFLLPGEFGDVWPATGPVDHAIVALTPLKVSMIPIAAVEAIMRDRAIARRTFERSVRQDIAKLRVWLANRRKPALERVTHLLCELRTRLILGGHDDADCMPLPLTQAELADAVGLTPMHVNRILSELRNSGVAKLTGGVLSVLDGAQFIKLAGFNAAYLRS